MPADTIQTDPDSLTKTAERPRPRWALTRLDSIVRIVFGVIIVVMGIITILMPLALTPKDRDFLSDPLVPCMILLITGMVLRYLPEHPETCRMEAKK